MKINFKKISIILITFFAILFFPINQNLSATKDYQIEMKIWENKIWKWVHLPGNIDTIYLKFLDNQKNAFLETDWDKKIKKLTADNFLGYDDNENSTISEKQNFSQILYLKNSHRIKINSKWAVKIFWWKKWEWKFFSEWQKILTSIKIFQDE